jgi:hypothetical protein
MLDIFNVSFTSFTGPKYWKHVKMKLLAKKESICYVSNTRPISLLDIFLKVLERLFLKRFQTVLHNRGILNDTQSGFRSNFRLQSRVLTLIDQISSYMSSSLPVATLFVDFKQAFDQLWWAGCLGKLIRLGIPKAYVNWIESWLIGRKAYVEMNNKCSRFFPISRGGPQGSCLTPAIFITYHSDMWSYLENTLPNFFADDLACVIGGRMGVKHNQQCLDLEMKLKKSLDYLEFYAVLAVQPINYDKTELMWSTRAICKPPFEVQMDGHKLSWVNSFRYLGYQISCKLGWGKMIAASKLKIRQRIAVIRSCSIYGFSSQHFRRTLFSVFVLPLFTWIFSLFPLFTNLQRDDLSHFFFTCLKRISRQMHWNDIVFSYLYDEKTLENRVAKYWKKFLHHLDKSIDGMLLYEQQAFNSFRNQWLNKEYTVRFIRRSKRLRPYVSVIETCARWLNNNSLNSIPCINDDDLSSLSIHPISFL